MKKILSVLMLPAAVAFSCSVTAPISYPDKDLPGKSPKVFAPGIVSLPQTREGALSFSPDGKELFFTKAVEGNRVSIMTMQFQDGKWTEPNLWEHSNVASNSESYVAPGGKEIYFISTRHAPKGKGSGRIWKSIKTKEGWGSPVEVMHPVVTDKGIWFPTVSNNGKVFFGAYLDSIGNLGKSDIYVKDLKSKDTPIQHIGYASINSAHEEWDPYIAPDESYLLFESDRPGGYGAVDIYVSFNVNGEWQSPVNLGRSINTSAYEVAAKVSPDGKFIFFDRPMKDEQNIYWVSSTVLDSLRQQVLSGK